MAEIKLVGMSFYAHHGYYIHEQKRGNNYIVDVSMELNIDEAAVHDDLHLTVNYEVIYRICNEIMEEPCKLIETVAYRIAHEVKKVISQPGKYQSRHTQNKTRVGWSRAKRPGSV